MSGSEYPVSNGNVRSPGSNVFSPGVALALAISACLHIVAIAVVVVLPMVFLEILPERDLLTFLIEPPPPPPPPPPPVQVAMNRTLESFPQYHPVDFPPNHMPVGIPLVSDMPDIVDLSRLTVPPFPQLPAGIPGGQETGILSSVPEPPALPPPPRPPVRARPILLGGNVLASRITHRVEPVYPPIAIRARISGMVVPQIQVDEEGRVGEVRVLSGHPLLREAALAAVRQGKYSPTLLNGEPVPVTGTVTVVFSLKVE